MNIHRLFQRVNGFLKEVYKRVNTFSGGTLEIIRSSIQRFGEERGSEAAAGMAYYAFFSIFPMLLVFISVGSFFVDQEIVTAQLLNIVQDVLPGAEEVIVANIEQVLQARSAVTLFALVSLIWSATSAFNLLVININRAFPKASVPNFLKGRLLGFLMILALGLLMLLSFAISTVSSVIPAVNISLNGQPLHETFLWRVGGFLVPVLANLMMFWAMYQWVPTLRVSRKASLIGAAIAGVTWELLNNIFTWYLSSGLSQYKLVYGSLGTVVALLFWIYITGVITLIGAHLAASIQNAIQEKPDEPSG